MTGVRSSPTVWLVDPISYSGMAYSDVGQIVALRELGADVLLIGSDSWMLERGIVPRVGVFRGTHGSRSRARKGARYLLSLARLVARTRRIRPDVIHWQFTEVPIADVIAMLAIKFLGTPQAYTAHELLPWTARRHHRWLFTRLYGIVDAVIVHSERQQAEIIRRFAISPSKVHVAPLGDYSSFATPELPQSAARRLLDLGIDEPVALFFGTIRPSKGLEVLLEAWAIVVRSLPQAKLVVTGKPYKGLDPQEVVDRIKQLGITDNVSTTFEQVDPDATNLHYRAADVVVLPYREIGTSGVLRYAYNSAVPVVATAVGEHRQHVVPDLTGRLVPPGDPQALAAALMTSLQDRDELRSMGKAARRYAASNFGWIEPARELLRIYEGLMKRSAGRY